MEPLSPERISALFNREFESTDCTILAGGVDEPFFLPGKPSRIYFRSDFARSALHEVAHWCVAGSYRRQLADYGYWYSPDGRDSERQDAFFCVEAKPQAIESIFCAAAGLPFALSADNVERSPNRAEIAHFLQRILHWQQRFALSGLPARAARFLGCLRSHGSDDAGHADSLPT
ncbi:MAG: elongation factor P hydroxylase [Luminiphilus sp.]|nr:elongation factor P hydroxylase [Luminiphilus sp.]